MKSADPILRGHPVLSGRVAHYVSNVSGYLIIHSPQDFSGIITALTGGLCQTA